MFLVQNQPIVLSIFQIRVILKTIFFSSKNPNNFCCIISKILLILILSSCMTMPRNTKAQRNTSFYDTQVLKQHMKSLCDIFTKKCGVAKKIGTALQYFSIACEREKEHFFLFALAAAELKIRGGNEGGVKLDPSSSSSQLNDFSQLLSKSSTTCQAAFKVIAF